MRLKDEHTELFGQLHPTRNVGVDLDAISNSSHEMLWWRCPVGHEWREAPLQRRSHAAWKKGDLYACLYCVAPGAVVHSCGHRRLRPSETTFRVLAHPCDKCEVTEHTRLILDALDGSAGAAVRLLDDSPLYALFCGAAADTVEWWVEIFPLARSISFRGAPYAAAPDNQAPDRSVSQNLSKMPAVPLQGGTGWAARTRYSAADCQLGPDR
ncbi:zinc-ribbon domain-containing protein [Rhodococcus sp. NPDC057529]|uniref:zinc-ribbon domain-containing protein n=1 Tax=Rhodococcus sp. NPDC057529 TaxID=3346158 RepID=UPI00366EB721